MIKIGVVNIDVSHPVAFSTYLNKGDRARYTAVYNDGFRGDDEVEVFMKKCGVSERYFSIEEMADHVDIGFVQGCNWDRHLMYAMPFINKGKPVFIDKPMVGNITECKKLEQLVRDGAVILGSSSVRYANEIVEFAQKTEEEKGKVLNVFGTAGVDEFNYAIHVVEGICGIAGCEAISNSFAGRSSIDGKVCETFFIRFANGMTAAYNSFSGTWHPFEYVIMTTKTTFQFRIDTSKIYGALLDRICDYVESGKIATAPIEKLTDSIKVLLAGRISREKGGGEVKLSEIPDDDPGFDGNAFEVKYAAAASKLV